MFRNLVYCSSLFSTKKMFLLKSIHPLSQFKCFVLSSRKISLPPIKLLTSGLQQMPPPFYPEPPNYSFLVAFCFGILVIFNRK